MGWPKTTILWDPERESWLGKKGNVAITVNCKVEILTFPIFFLSSSDLLRLYFFPPLQWGMWKTRFAFKGKPLVFLQFSFHPHFHFSSVYTLSLPSSSCLDIVPWKSDLRQKVDETDRKERFDGRFIYIYRKSDRMKYPWLSSGNQMEKWFSLSSPFSSSFPSPR